jgi:hypothetical protein
MKIVSLFVLTFMLSCTYSHDGSSNQAFEPAIKLSQDFLQAIKTAQDYTVPLQQLELIPLDTLMADLQTEQQKLTFWINLYNATTQYLLKNNPEYFQNRGDFYKRKAIKIAGIYFSLDEIEHGILRRNANKLSLGYLKKWHTPKHIKKLMLKTIDPRIHFALNCGAKSCPPVLFFEAEKIDEQLDLATKGYLDAECEFKEGKLHVPILFSWFRGDFGGKNGIYKFLWKYELVKKGEKPTLIYKEYNWTLSVGNYK